ncbi:hypothetical protein N7494_004780 [Penicillium frequentans]|uniref:Uncharacterized protein n=1 Tax=Penicillium frequentans TaxID=3151616 RepID=A0AAD6D195_9EURO|nr:hypothetical protein N7494_004780 [Penicillium glabrum]
MSYFHTEYSKFLANPRSAQVAANISLIYVTSTTKFEGSDSVLTHLSRQSSIVKKKAENIINAIESSDSLVLDIETTLEFLQNGGAYLPSLSEDHLADRVVTIPTLHIVRWNAQHEIQQVRIYWDQGSLLKEVEMIGARSRNWPIRTGLEHIRLLRSAANAQPAPPLATSQEEFKEPPARPGSPGKRHIRDPYGAGSLANLLSPGKDTDENERPPRPSSPGKRHHRDPYGAGSLSELLSPSKAPTAPVLPYAPSSAKPPARNLSDIFIDEDAPPTPSKAERVIAPKAGARKPRDEDNLDQDRAPYRSNPKRFNHFEIGADNADLEVSERAPKGSVGNLQETRDEINLDQTRAPYKSNPKRFNHFEIGADDREPEKTDESKRGKPRNQSQWDFGDVATPKKAAPVHVGLSEQDRNFGCSDEAGAPTPPVRQHVNKPRRDADVHFQMNEDTEEDDGRIISSYQSRGQGLYENRLFDEGEQESKGSAPLSQLSNNSNRQKSSDVHWAMGDISPAVSKKDDKNVPVPEDRLKSVKMMESSWDNYDQSPEPIRTATSLRNPNRHNQPSWTFGADE